MRKKSLYDYFECKNKEELYELVKNEDEKVRELIDYINSNENTLNKTYDVKNLDSIKNLILEGELQLPKKEEFSVISLNSGLSILDNKIFDKDTNINEIIGECYSPLMTNFIIIQGENSKNQVDRIENDLRSFGYSKVERINREEENKIYAEMSDKYELLENIKPLKKNKTFYKVENKLSNYENYQEFMKYYEKNELIGKNFLFQNKEIRNILKKSNEDFHQENFIILQHDNKLNIINYESLFKGGIQNSTVDLRVVLSKLLNKNTIAISIVHNHPSGKVNPSRADIEVTNAIEKMCKKLNKSLIDHFIVGKEKVFSFSDEGLLNSSYKSIISNIDNKKLLEKLIEKDYKNFKYIKSELIDKNLSLVGVKNNADIYLDIPEYLKKR